MLISIPTTYGIVDTNVIDSHEIYDASRTYQDKELVRYDPNGGDYYRIYGVFNDDTLPAPHHRFVYYSETAPNSVNDGKNYSFASRNDSMYYEISVNGDFDTIAIGRIIADNVAVNFYDKDEALVYQAGVIELDNKIDKEGLHPQEPITVIIYSPNAIASGGRVKIVVNNVGREVHIGSIVAGLSVEAGFTNLVFSNKFKDFSPTEQDQWGNVSYVDGTKINVHTGTVDIPVTNYDHMNRLMRSIGGKEVIVNGYGVKHNDTPDNKEGAFYATNMIGRMKNFSLSTKMINKRLGELAQYKITIEEIV